MTEFAKNAQKPCQAFFSKKHPKIEQISDDFKSNLLYAALPKGHWIVMSFLRWLRNMATLMRLQYIKRKKNRLIS